MRWFVPSAGCALVAAALAAPTLAFAGEEADVAAARRLGQEGVLAAQAGKCAEAIDKLGRAKMIMPVPSILTPLGECQIQIGKIVAGTENLQAAIRYKLPADAPDAYAKAQAKAKAELPAALKRLGKLTIVVKAPDGASAEVTDNGERVSAALVGAENPADPGAHEIVVTGKGLLRATQSVTLAEGASETVTLTVEKDPAATKVDLPKDPDPKGPDPKPIDPPPPGTSPLVPAGAVLASVGLVGVVVGGVFGGLALGTKGRLDDACDANKGCPPSSSSDIDELETFSHVSTGMLVGGGVIAATGAFLLGFGLTRGTSSSSSAFIEPVVGPAFIGVRGRL